MPVRNTWLLERVREIRPHTIRILATAFSDLVPLLRLSKGAIYRYVTKPWDVRVETSLKRGMEFFGSERAGLPIAGETDRCIG